MQAYDPLTFGPACLISGDFAAVVTRSATLNTDGVDRDWVFFCTAGDWTCIPALGLGCQLIYDPPKRELLIVTGDGIVQVVDAEGWRKEIVDPSPEGPSNLQRILGLSRIGDAIYAYGASRQVYRRSEAETWERVDAGLRSPDVAAIKSMCGHDESEIYAVGFKGEIWIRQDGQWRSVDSPTKAKLEHVTATAAGDFVACGGGGVVLRGRGARWSVLPQPHVGDTLWSASEFEDTLYMATETRLLALRGDRLEDVTGLPADARTFGFLATSESSIWSVGRLDLLGFDRRAWTRIEPPPMSSS